MKDFLKFMVLLVPFLIVGAVFLVLGYQALPGELTDDGYPLGTFFYIMGAVFIFGPLLLVVGLSLLATVSAVKESNMKQHGIKGTATIVATEQTGVFINENPQVRFKLQVELPGRPSFQAEHKEVVELIKLYAIAPGSIHVVYVDPNDDRKIMLEL